MNPVSADQGGGEEYAGSEALDPALADRFAVIVEVGDWDALDEVQQRLVANPAGEGRLANDGGALRALVQGWRRTFEERLPDCSPLLIDYARIAATELNGAGIRISPRRVRLLVRTLLAAAIVEGGMREPVFRTVLECSLPQRAWGGLVSAERVGAAHRLAWDIATASGRERWLHEFHLERRLARKLALLAEHCPDTDAGTLAIEQLLANEDRVRVAAFALAVYPAALTGALPVGAEAVADLGRQAVPMLDLEGELRWQEPVSQQDTTHPELPAIAAVLDSLADPARAARARQLLYWALLHKVAVPDPAALEAEFHEAVVYLAGRARA
jgi:MoxR-like ATPase